MRQGTLLLVILAAALLSGCLCALNVRVVGALPDEWQTGRELTVFRDGTWIQGGGYSHLMLNTTDWSQPPPVRCTPYRGESQVAGDECEIRVESGDYNGIKYGPWTSYASWENGCENERGHRSAVVVFDDHDNVVAFWAGDIHPRAGRMIE